MATHYRPVAAVVTLAVAGLTGHRPGHAAATGPANTRPRGGRSAATRRVLAAPGTPAGYARDAYSAGTGYVPGTPCPARTRGVPEMQCPSASESVSGAGQPALAPHPGRRVRSASGMHRGRSRQAAPGGRPVAIGAGTIPVAVPVTVPGLLPVGVPVPGAVPVDVPAVPAIVHFPGQAVPAAWNDAAEPPGIRPGHPHPRRALTQPDKTYLTCDAAAHPRIRQNLTEPRRQPFRRCGRALTQPDTTPPCPRFWQVLSDRAPRRSAAGTEVLSGFVGSGTPWRNPRSDRFCQVVSVRGGRGESNPADRSTQAPPEPFAAPTHSHPRRTAAKTDKNTLTCNGAPHPRIRHYLTKIRDQRRSHPTPALTETDGKPAANRAPCGPRISVGFCQSRPAPAKAQVALFLSDSVGSGAPQQNRRSEYFCQFLRRCGGGGGVKPARGTAPRAPRILPDAEPSPTVALTSPTIRHPRPTTPDAHGGGDQGSGSFP